MCVKINKISPEQIGFPHLKYSGNNDIYATIYDPPVKEYLEDGSILFEDGTLRASPQRVERLIPGRSTQKRRNNTPATLR